MWGAYSWLGNQAAADQTILRSGMSLAMIGVFIAALSILEAYDDLPGGWHGPLVLVIAYLVVRLIHAVLYLLVAGEDAALRRQVLTTQGVAFAPSAAALIVGAVIGGQAQTWIWLGALLYDLALLAISSRGGGGWRVNSVAHWAERYGLVVILALGESIVSIGGGVAREPVDGLIVLGVALAVTLSILLWWSYFARASAAGEAALEQRTGSARVVLALNAYTMLHLVIVVGVILSAFGVEQVMDHVGDAEPLGVFGAATFAGGLALFTVAITVFERAVGLPWSAIRITTGAVVLAAVPGLAMVPPLGVLAIVVALLGAMFAIEQISGRRAPSRARRRLVRRPVGPANKPAGRRSDDGGGTIELIGVRAPLVLLVFVGLPENVDMRIGAG
jgi:low temperature requirement protein LtrA